jgi:calcineurin-like phosphoesterase family protein
MIRLPLWAAVLAAALIVPGAAQEKNGAAAPEAFTFLFWTDQELDPGKEAKLIPHIDAMHAMAGKSLPAPLGSKLEAPDFVASAGDSTGWPSHGAVQSWNKVCRELLKIPTRAVAGNHDSGGAQPNEQFYEWLRRDPFVKAHASDNGLPAWKPPQAETGIIPGVQYSFRHKGVVFIMPSPTYDNSGKSPPGTSPIYKPDVDWLKKELAKYAPKEPKIVVNHFNAGSITNREEIDALYKENGVVLHLCGHWEQVQHWRYGETDWVMDAGHRGKDGTFSAVRVGRDSIQIAHWVTDKATWHEAVIDRKIASRW